jgi:hypothetical protein
MLAIKLRTLTGVLLGAGLIPARQAPVPGSLAFSNVPLVIPEGASESGFQPGSATAHIEAIVSNRGTVMEDTHWTRDVLLSISK